MFSKPINCSKVAQKGKLCSRLLEPQKVAPNAKSCSKVADHNPERPILHEGRGSALVEFNKWLLWLLLFLMLWGSFVHQYYFFDIGPKHFYNPSQGCRPGEAGFTVECNLQSHRKPNAIYALEKRKNTRGCHSKTPCPWSCDANHITRNWSWLGKLHLCGRKFPGCYDCACQASRWATLSLTTVSIVSVRKSKPRPPTLQSSALSTELTLPNHQWRNFFNSQRWFSFVWYEVTTTWKARRSWGRGCPHSVPYNTLRISLYFFFFFTWHSKHVFLPCGLEQSWSVEKLILSTERLCSSSRFCL